MEAPVGGQSSEAFNKEIADHIATHYTKVSGSCVCNTCASPIQQTTCYVSLHTTLFSGCAGSGKVRQIPLPYCPKCEGLPKRIASCVHNVLDD
jgi:hypothetical protein